MPRKNTQSESKPRQDQPQPAAKAAPSKVRTRRILMATGVFVGAAGLWAWITLCLFFRQTSWQLLYHPSHKITETPANAGLAFNPVGFAATDTGAPQLRGWWIPAASGAPLSRYTVLYLHGRNGDLSDTVPALAAIHAAGVNLLAFDYRGYGQSEYARPTEAHWREDAQAALGYLTGMRHIASRAIVLDGAGLGANLALEVAAAHPELAGVVLDEPLASPLKAVFSDPRAQLVPARLLVRDRYRLKVPATKLRIPSLWLLAAQPSAHAPGPIAQAYAAATAPRKLVQLTATPAQQDSTQALATWLNSLSR